MPYIKARAAFPKVVSLSGFADVVCGAAALILRLGLIQPLAEAGSNRKVGLKATVVLFDTSRTNVCQRRRMQRIRRH